MSAANVARKSTELTSSPEVFPAGTLPGHRAIIGIRVPPSYGPPLNPRSAPLHLCPLLSAPDPSWYPSSITPPLSLVNITRVLSAS